MSHAPKFRLELITPKNSHTTKIYALKRKTIYIGSALQGVSGNKVKVKGAGIEAVHAQIYILANKVNLLNLTKSAKALTINGERVYPGEPRVLKDGATILVGEKLTIKYKTVEDEPSTGVAQGMYVQEAVKASSVRKSKSITNPLNNGVITENLSRGSDSALPQRVQSYQKKDITPESRAINKKRARRRSDRAPRAARIRRDRSKSGADKTVPLNRNVTTKTPSSTQRKRAIQRKDTKTATEFIRELNRQVKHYERYCNLADIWKKYDNSSITVIGSGGQGIVLRAFTITSREPVAIKILKIDEDSPGRNKYLKREVLLNSALKMVGAKRKQLCYAKEIYMFEGSVYLVFEWMKMGSVTTLCDQFKIEEKRDSITDELVCQREAGLGEQGALAVGYFILEALVFLHKRRIAHRDVKPENILIGNDFTTYLCDFGCSVTYGGVNTLLESHVGTPDFSDPDVWKNSQKVYNAQAHDVYSFGKCLEFLAGTAETSDAFNEFISTCYLPQQNRPKFSEMAKLPLWKGLNKNTCIRIITTLRMCGAKLQRLKDDLHETQGQFAVYDDSGTYSSVDSEGSDTWKNWSYIYDGKSINGESPRSSDKSPRHAEASPRHAAASPRHAEASPRHHEKSPRYSEQAPPKKSISKSQGSVRRQLASNKLYY